MRLDPRCGAGLAEVMVALVVVTIGLLGIAGLLRLAARETALARRVEAAHWAAAALADSLVAGGLPAEGERIADWGVLRWTASEGEIRLEARSGGDEVEPWIRIHIPDPERAG